VRLNYLSLSNFRNYTRLELSLPDRLTVLQGANAQGKTNLLEAIHLLATGRSPRAGAERELINWLALESPLPYARLEGQIGEGKQAQKLELVLDLAGNGAGTSATARKQVRINGVPKRGLDLVGHLRVVLFLPEDISLVTGAPAERRRYLDIALCQIAPTYCRALSEYNRALAQRNALLRRLRDEGGDPGQLSFWDEQVAAHTGVLFRWRSEAVHNLDRIAAERHRDLTGGVERLHTVYLPGFDPDLPPSEDPRLGAAARARLSEARTTYHVLPHEEVKERFLAQLSRIRARETAAGTSLLGPHRDDVVFSVDGRDLRAFGSRGQQRTGALALKLAEVGMMQEQTGDMPLLLLDDVMSELDAARRHALRDVLTGVAQVLVTTTDWSSFTPELLRQARTLKVEAGRVLQVSPEERAEPAQVREMTRPTGS
jgi:DNA replication and repair protein RecF